MAIIGQVTENGRIRTPSGAFVPTDPDNPDYKLILERLRRGDTLAPFVPSTKDLPKEDLDALNAALTQEGSVVRALGLVMFAEINKLRAFSGQNEYTLQQFRNALLGKMRDETQPSQTIPSLPEEELQAPGNEPEPEPGPGD